MQLHKILYYVLAMSDQNMRLIFSPVHVYVSRWNSLLR